MIFLPLTTGAFMAAADYIDAVQEIYIGYYGRPADPEGLAYWTARLDAAKGNLDEILDAFGTSDEADTLFGNGRTNEESVTSLYNQILNRDPDDEGLAFYVDGLESGEFTLVDVAKRIVDGVQNDDVEILTNKVAAAKAFTDAIDADANVTYDGDSAATVARNWLATVDGDADNLTAALESLADQVTDLTPVNRALVVGSEIITGSSVNDVFTAVTSSLTTTKTLDLTDKVTGDAGDDEFQVSMSADFVGFTTGSVSGVETIKLTNATTATRAFDATGITGATGYVVDATKGAINISDLATGLKSVSLIGQETGSFTTVFIPSAAEVAGTANELSLTLTDVGAEDPVDLKLGSFEVLNITSTGTNDVSIDNDIVTKIVVTGAGDLTVNETGTALTSFDASAATGDITAVLSDVTTANQLKTIKTGAGDDSITVTETAMPANATIDGGAGDDTITYSTNGGVVEYNLSGVETFAITSATTAAFTYSAKKTTGLTEVSTDADVAQAVSFVNMGSGDFTFTSIGATVDAGDVSSDHTGSTTVAYTTTGTTAVNPDADYTFAKATGSLTVSAGAYTNPQTTTTITAALASSVSLSVAANSTYKGKITAAKAESITVNATGTLDATAEIVAAAATSATISNGSKDGGLKLTAADLETLTVSTSGDLSFTTSTLTALQSLSVTATADAVTFGNLADLATVSASGSGTTSALTLGAVGGDNDYDFSLTASGLKAGLTVGAINVSDGYDVTINAEGLTGKLDLAAIGDVTVGDSVTINADGIGGAFDVAAVVAEGDVIINASGTSGAATVVSVSTSGDVTIDLSGNSGISDITGNVSGDNVSIDISESASTSSIDGTVTAITSATLVLNDLEANTETIQAGSGSKALAVAITGGIGADVITINGVSTQTGITVTGNTNASTDTISINSFLSANAQTISLAGYEDYESSVIETGAGKDTITGGSGDDRIIGRAGQDSLTGGDGADNFVFRAGDSSASAPDTITDLTSDDFITYADADVTLFTTNTAGTSTTPAISEIGVVSFASITDLTAWDTLTEKAALIDAITGTSKAVYFEHDGSTYIFIDTNSANDIVVKLVGVPLPTAAASSSGTTGLTGIGG